MDTRTTPSGRAARSRRRPPSSVRRPGLYLGVAAAGAVLVHVVVGAEPAAVAEAGATESVSVAQELGLSASAGPVDLTRDLQPLEDLAATRSTREDAQVAAAQVQAAADQAVLDRQRAEAEAAARAAAEAEAAAQREAAERQAAEQQAQARAQAEAQEQAAAPAAAAPPTAARASTAAAGAVAKITNSAGGVKPQVQAAANAVVSNVPGFAGNTIGGTRASAADPGGHPSGLAADYMVGTDAGLGDAVAQYHIAHWEELGVDYVIWKQRMLSSPGGAWKAMADRGGVTANHFDHVHVNYRG
ncbi:hypothetical protein [Geodermatophilus sp. CPCC 206100]|uniref:hypothetical protein n=1 Tax=Geodermatophilus sp. CPCC 206100 TaxID=3020054 RepID=UPI003B003CB7